MFTKEEYAMIVQALAMMAKSAQRLANKEGQPTSVAVEYRKVIGEVSALARKVDGEAQKAKK